MPDRRFMLLWAVTMPFASQAVAHSYMAGDIAIGHVWGLPTGTRETQVFVPFSNRGQTADALIAARSPFCSMIELRPNNRYDDPPLAEIELLPGKPVALRKGARHLRLLGLRGPLKAGDRFDMILDFRRAGEAAVAVIIENGAGH